MKTTDPCLSRARTCWFKDCSAARRCTASANCASVDNSQSSLDDVEVSSPQQLCTDLARRLMQR